MAYFLQQLINGVTLGSVYALIAIGYTLVYGIIRMINFAHGEVYMIGAFISVISFLVLTAIGISETPLILILMFLGAVVLTGAYGWSIERIAYRPLRGSFRLAPLISAIGVSIFLQNYVQLSQGARAKPIAPVIYGSFTWTSSADDFVVSVSYIQVLIVILTAALMGGFWYVIHCTPLGRYQRACAEDKTMAALLGVNVDKTISLTFVMGSAMAAVAGFMVVLYYGVANFSMGFQVGIKAFTAAVLGGIGSLPGALLGGVLIGLIEAFWSGYFSVEYKDAAAFLVLILVLTLRPSGLLGRPDIEKV